MTLKLEAFSPAEGIALIRAGSTIRLVRPPYEFRDSPILAENSLQDAVLRFGFFTSTEQFERWEDLIAFLNSKIVATRREIGKEIPNEISGKEILEVAPLDILLGFLDRIEKEIIPQQLFDQAENFLLALLSSKAREHAEVFEKAVTLLKQNTASRKKLDICVSELNNRDIRFRNLEQQSTEYLWSIRVTDQIQKRGSVFALAS